MPWDEDAHHNPEDFDVSDTDQIWDMLANGSVIADVQPDWDDEGQSANVHLIDSINIRSMNIERLLLNIHQRLLVLEGKLPALTKHDSGGDAK